MDAKLPQVSVAQHLAERIATLRADTLPPAVRRKCEDLLIDVRDAGELERVGNAVE